MDRKNRVQHVPEAIHAKRLSTEAEPSAPWSYLTDAELTARWRSYNQLADTFRASDPNGVSTFDMLDQLATERGRRTGATGMSDAAPLSAYPCSPRCEGYQRELMANSAAKLLAEALTRIMAAERAASRADREALVALRFETDDQAAKLAAQTIAGRELTSAWEFARAALGNAPARSIAASRAAPGETVEGDVRPPETPVVGDVVRCPNCGDLPAMRQGQWTCTCDYEAWLAGFEL